MKAAVVWRGADGTEIRRDVEDVKGSFAALVEAEILSFHVANPDRPVTLYLDTGDLHARVTCGRCNKRFDFDIPPAMLSAAVLAVHTDHEGHPLKIEYAGKTITSPHFPGQ